MFYLKFIVHIYLCIYPQIDIDINIKCAWEREKYIETLMRYLIIVKRENNRY